MKVKRFDGREWNELRPISAEVGIVPNASGSAIFKFGDTIALAAVYGPRSVPKFMSTYEKATLRVRYNLLSFSVPERKKPGPGRREIELSEVIKRALEPILFLEEFPNTVIDVYIEILQADAGTRCAGINAASLALANAGIPMKDLLVAVAVGKVGEKVVIDLTKEEEDYDSEALRQDPEKKKFVEYYGEGKATDIPITIIPKTGEITLLQLDGEISESELKKALNLAIKSSKKIRKIMEEAIVKKYEKEMKF